MMMSEEKNVSSRIPKARSDLPLHQITPFTKEKETVKPKSPSAPSDNRLKTWMDNANSALLIKISSLATLNEVLQRIHVSFFNCFSFNSSHHDWLDWLQI